MRKFKVGQKVKLKDGRVIKITDVFAARPEKVMQVFGKSRILPATPASYIGLTVERFCTAVLFKSKHVAKVEA
jgi:hypothetical protein